MTIERIALQGSENPNFFGCWTMADTSVCDRLVAFFEAREDLQVAGETARGTVQETVKKSTDITISPLDLKEDGFEDVSVYLEHLKECYSDYLTQWDFLGAFLKSIHIGPFNIQKYDEGGHFGKLHSERTSLNSLHRILVWMTYLNDVAEGGETEFPLFGVNVQPEKGKTLIWPAEWTHAHRGAVVTKGSKYIITGWMHFPDDA